MRRQICTHGFNRVTRDHTCGGMKAVDLAERNVFLRCCKNQGLSRAHRELCVQEDGVLVLTGA